MKLKRKLPSWLTRKPSAPAPGPGRKDWILWGALGCALASTAHAEYTLATAAHFNEYVALAVPGALDLYVVRALQQRRDVFVAVLAMVAANVTSHLIAGGVLGVQWPVIAAVGAVAPLIVWRVYSLKYTRNRQEILWDLPAGAVKSPDEDAPGVIPIGPEVIGAVAPAPAWVPGYHLDGCDGVHLPGGPAACLHRAGVLEAECTSAPVPDSVPEEWSAAEYGDPDVPIPYLRAVPDPECTEDDVPEGASAVHLNVGDEEYIETARRYVAGTDKPSVRGMKDYAKVGQARAERLLAYLGVRP